MEKKSVSSLGVILEKDYSNNKVVEGKKKKSSKKTTKKTTKKNGEGQEDNDNDGGNEADLVTALSVYFLQVELSSREDGKERPIKSDLKSRFSSCLFVMLLDLHVLTMS
jgi:hypothetical protein